MTFERPPVDEPFLADGGELGALMRAHDWSASPLGRPAGWPQSLRTVVGLMLTSKFPMFVAWGPELGFLYNDAYAEILGDKHPSALGDRFQTIWSEIWPDISPLIDAALAGQASYRHDLPLLMRRKGFDEQTWFTFSYSPVRDESGAVVGMFCACAETTEKVLAERRLSFLVELGDSLQAARTPLEVKIAAAEALGRQLDVSRAGYGEVVEHGEVVRVDQDWTAEGVRSLAGEARLLDGFGPQVIAELRAGRVVVVEDCERDPRTADEAYLETWRGIGTRALIVAPLLRDGELSAILYAHAAAPRRWTSDEVSLVGDVATRTWSAHAQALAEDAQSASEGRLRLAHRAAQLGDFTWDVESDATTLSEQFQAMLGLPQAALPRTGEDFFAYVLEEDLPDLRTVCERVLRGETERFDAEFRIRRTDGEVIWLAAHAQGEEPGPDGVPKRVVGVNYDVTQRKRAEEALRESESRFRNMAEHAPIIMWVTDPHGNCIYLNKAWYDFTGQTEAEALGLGWTDATHPDDTDLATETFLTGNARREAFYVEYRLRHVSGGYRWAIDAAAPRFGPRGDFLGFVGSVIDISQRRAAEEVLRQSHEALERRIDQALAERKLLADIVEGTDAFVQVVSPDFRWLAINKAAADEFHRIFGIRPQVGASLIELLADQPEHQAAIRAIWARALTGEAFTETAEFGDTQRDRRWYEMKFRPLRDAQGQFVAAYQFVYDVTERLQDQRRLTETQDALRQSQKMEAIGQLTGGVAHDFNNLLTPIVGALDMLQRRSVGGAREQRLIDGALQSAERARVLVQRLLAFARRQPLQATAVDVPQLLEGMGDLISSTTGPQIRVAVNAPVDLPPAKADRNQLEMAILNLAVNARDAMPDGGVLRLSAELATLRGAHRSRLPAGDYIRLSVADTGVGMDAETQAKAIEPFFSTKGIGRGTGLGLSMVHGLALQLNGALTIESAPGLGANIELWLPVSREAIQPEAAPRAAERRSFLGTVLLVDDEEVVRISTSDMLTDLGYRVVEAASAEEALRLLGEGLDPQLVVTDHLMPGMTGTDLARELRRTHPGVRTLLVSGYAEAEGVAPDLPRLTKPFRNADLAEAMAALGVEPA
ncbi:PAS domain S-box protein [Phenylobacterium sp. J426]|uniref:PAS domain S-box protein n=1 Tax=Phenylobacterium sp. J426 TaxID=2898439 RepID=UPI002150EA72|nr:PAS domain S-box protein [Phenylobacterium sp. J426]MCR5874822.1 PAS domain S-box protein [Phenylobacterium sp. J426]